MIVTFDVFSALTNSRSGAGAFLGSVAESRGWPVTGVELYDRWDALNKESHRRVTAWMSFRVLSIQAMAATLRQLDLPTDDAPEVSDALLESIASWPLWPDVSVESLGQLGAARLGLLSNIDDDLLATSAAVKLGVFDPEIVVTSERAQAYKPSALLYQRASGLIGSFVHVASSARDVRGALSAGITTVRLVRDGHSVDPDGRAPDQTATSIAELAPLLACWS